MTLLLADLLLVPVIAVGEFKEPPMESSHRREPVSSVGEDSPSGPRLSPGRRIQVRWSDSGTLRELSAGGLRRNDDSLLVQRFLSPGRALFHIGSGGFMIWRLRKFP